MKRKLLIVLVLAALAGIVAVVYINKKSQRIAEQNAAQPPPAAKTNAPVMAKAAAPAPENLAEFKSKPGACKVRMEGTSSVHAWNAEGAMISGLLKIDKTVLAQPKPGPIYAVVKTLIPVTSLKSSSGPPMDTVMYGPKGFETEKGPDYQKIVYNLESLVIKKAPASPADPIECDSRGDLVIHTVTNKIDLPVTITKDDAGGLFIKGSTKLRMSSFGIPPVQVDLGVSKIITGDEVDVLFEWKLAPIVK
jgi:hypothetical protein